MFVIEIKQGETLFRELAIKDETGLPVDISATAKSIEVGDPLLETSFTVTTGSETNIIEVRVSGFETELWPVGKYPLQVWLDWGVESGIRHEVIFEAIIAVRSKA